MHGAKLVWIQLITVYRKDLPILTFKLSITIVVSN